MGYYSLGGHYLKIRKWHIRKLAILSTLLLIHCIRQALKLEVVMKGYKRISFLVLMVITSASWGYGSSSSSSSCAKPKFTEFNPVEHSQVPVGASFSFVASANTSPESIKVTVKDLPVITNVLEEKNGTFKVSGLIPDSLKGVYARVSITGNSQSSCNENAGWLFKIAD